MYEEIKNNIIENFFNTHYLLTSCLNKDIIINDIKERMPFEVSWKTNDSINMNLGDGINVVFNLKWESEIRKISSGKEYTNYKLIKIY